MACCLFGAKPLSEAMLPYCQLGQKDTYFGEILPEILFLKVFIQENALEKVICKMAAILFNNELI